MEYITKEELRQVLREELNRLANPSKDIWINEEEAAALLNVEPETLRRNVVYQPTEKHKNWGKWVDIRFRKNPNGKGYQYSRKSIINFQENTSTAA